jgi:hypothetical protein
MICRKLKSKAVTLGNKLAPRIGDRRVAFIRAWAIVKAGGLEPAPVVDRQLSLFPLMEGEYSRGGTLTLAV